MDIANSMKESQLISVLDFEMYKHLTKEEFEKIQDEEIDKLINFNL